MTIRRGRPSAAAVAAWILLAAGATLAGCGGGDSAQPGGAGPGGLVDTDPRLADCTDWNRAGVEQRLAIVNAIEAAAKGPAAGTATPPGEAPLLSDDEAYDLFEEGCDSPKARAFTLYVLYVRAAGFQSVQPGK